MSGAAVGQRTWLGIAKQPAFGTKTPPAIFHGISSASPVPKWAWIERPEARLVIGRVLSAPGPYSMSNTLKVAPDPGAVEQLLAYAMGSQSAPTPAAIYTTTASQAVTTAGAQTVTVTPGSTPFAPGNVVVYDFGGANQETITLTAGTANSLTGVFTKTHPNGAVINLNGIVSMTSTMSFGLGKELPYFGMEHYRDTDCYDWIGNAIDTAKISVDMGGKLVDFEFGIVGNASAPVVNNAPATPAFVTTQPYTSELSLATYTGGGGAQQLGSGGVVPLQSAAISLNNQLDKNYRTVGSQYPVSFPLGQRKVSGTVKTGFESDQAFMDFLAQGTVAFSLKLISSSVIETINGVAVPYSITLTMPTCRIAQDPVSQPTSGPLNQTLSLEGYGSSIGANNDLTITTVGAATAIY